MQGAMRKCQRAKRTLRIDGEGGNWKYIRGVTWCKKELYKDKSRQDEERYDLLVQTDIRQVAWSWFVTTR